MRWLSLMFVLTGCTHVAPGCEVIKDTHEKITCTERAAKPTTDVSVPIPR